MAEIFRVFVEKKEGFDIEAQKMLAHISGYLGIESVRGLRIVNCYDVQGLNSKEFEICVKKVFSEANVDNVYFENLDADGFIFGKALLPGQYDQRADWAALCAQVLTGRLPLISFTKFHIVSGELSEADRASILKHAINPIDSMEVGLEKPKDLEKTAPIPADVASVDMNQDPAEIRKNMGLAMSQEDLAFLRDYFLNEEGRNPTVTEIKMIDTYWSDHCRHTTFHAALERIEFEDGPYKAIFEQTYSEYLAERAQIHADDRPVTLMDLATIGMKILRRDGHLDDLDVSEEVNAASIVIDVDFGDGESEEWLLMFKNETHNHPTEIEPFGGAATCLGGAIRDPLSGRAYVYQAMRVSGAGDPRATQEQTLPGKLPQRLITTQAAAGYSSYGNQIGLATGLVREIYHEDYRAKRMEIGAVIGAVKKEYVVREVPQKGDVVLLIGGRTGRDGIGGATGSSRAHEEKSLSSAGAEVQKGNPITQRKLQRLFRNPEAIRLIIRCNDFGAGGVSVAIGELADSIEINLDNVKKKYEGLDGTELAISESQERMAVVVRAKDVETLIRLAFNENLEAYQVAEITDTGRLVMTWRGKRIVDISREFLNSAGVQQKASVIVANPTVIPAQAGIPPTWLDNLRDLNVAGQKGLIEHFDSTVGAGTVLAPFGGKYQLTPTQAMAARIPVLGREAKTASLMSFGFNPYLSAQSPYHGAVYAVVESIARLVAAGVDYSKIRLSFQEYFEKLTDAKSWGKPFSAILGAFAAQMALKIPSIGGKDSMSGTYEGRYNVPPTLVSFSAAAAPIENIISPEFKRARNNIALIQTPLDENGLPNFEKLRKNFDLLHRLIADKVVISARAIGFGGLAAALSEMSFGNRIGVDVTYLGDFFSVGFGNFVVELGADSPEGLEVIGRTIAEPDLVINDERIAIEECIMAWLEPLEDVFPTGILGEAPVALDLGAP
ncbi:MAG: phosphoribosylformylglycinamidine synthase, partial [Clostridiales bacterium]|nr:phosphoribosylformylglycinamidine synthase [Clostridiales bacterium]